MKDYEKIENHRQYPYFCEFLKNDNSDKAQILLEKISKFKTCDEFNTLRDELFFKLLLQAF